MVKSLDLISAASKDTMWLKKDSDTDDQKLL